MQTEIEAKWLNIDINNMRQLLSSVGAKMVKKERLMSRKIYDFSDDRLNKKGGWARVRDEGDKITLSYKQLNDRSVHGTKEVSLITNDFESTCIFLESIGLEQKSFQQTKRESWELDGSEIELDTWPWIPSFIEIESKNEEKLKSIAMKLGLDYSKALHGSVETAYQAVYDITEEEIDNWLEILFIPVPSWLESKRRTHKIQ